MIRLDNICVTFNENTDLQVRALDNVSLEVAGGQWITVIGPNGSGKTTLLRFLAGEIKSTSGTVSLDGKDITSLGQHERAVHFQFIEQDTEKNLVASMTVAESLFLSLQGARKPSVRFASNTRKRGTIIDTLKLFEMDLEARLETQVRHLSGGQRAAVVVASAILRDAKVLLLDEFTASLDPRTAPLLLKIVMDLAEERGLTVLMVSHDIDEIIRCGQQVLFLNRGSIYGKRTPDEISVAQLRELYADAIVVSTEQEVTQNATG